MTANEGSSSGLRDYRKGNWTVQETMILIEAKKMDDERRMKRIIGDNTDQLSTGRGKPTELRWKWVEDYCWKNGCFRSQNQCNDKWDNLMRDFKKVRDYERRIEKGKGGDHEESHVLLISSSSSSSSYWNIEKHERKERNLPSNMLPQIYEALMAVVDKKGGGLRQQIVVPSSSSAGNIGLITTTNIIIPPNPLLHTTVPLQLPAPPQPPPPPPLVLPVPPLSTMPVYSQPLPAATMGGSTDSDTSEHSDSPEPPAAKRRRKGDVAGESNTNTDDTNTNNNIEEVIGTAISRSASIIAEAIKACEEREERRHRDLVRLHERRLQIEESKAEINRQGINGLVEAVNKLANSILVLASNKTTHHQPSTSSK